MVPSYKYTQQVQNVLGFEKQDLFDTELVQSTESRVPNRKKTRALYFKGHPKVRLGDLPEVRKRDQFRERVRLG